MTIAWRNASPRSAGSVVRHFLAPATRICAAAALLCLAPNASSAQSVMAPPRLVPERVEMGALYDGAQIRIEGTAPAGSQVLVIIRGEAKDEFFNRKGRVGPIWLNADRIHITRTPSLFLCLSCADLNSFLDRDSIDAYQLDEAAIKNRMFCRMHCKCSLAAHSDKSPHNPRQCTGVEPDKPYLELLRDSYVTLKKREGKYQMQPAAVRLTAAEDPATDYVADFRWPKQASPGLYQVEVYACLNRKVVARSVATLQVVEVGFPAYVFNLASAHPWRYGAAAVTVAMLSGFGIDTLAVRLRRRRQRAS